MSEGISSTPSEQEVFLRVKLEEFAFIRQVMLMSSGLVGFPAALLATGNLPKVNLSILWLSWVIFMLCIIVGAAYLRDVLRYNARLIWKSNNEKRAREVLKTISLSEHPRLHKDFTEALNQIREDKKAAEKILGSWALELANWGFYLLFFTGLILLASSFIF